MLRAFMRVLALGLLLLLWAGLLVPGLPANAAETIDETIDETAIETRIKAAFIRHFCTYINWPDSAFEKADSPIVLGVMGSGAMAEALRAVVGNRTAHNRPMVVREIDPGDALGELHVLFIANSMRTRIPTLAAAAIEQSVLPISESPRGLEAGSAINFTVEDDKVKFDIAPAVVRNAGLDVSAQLLTVARVIRQESSR
ncbi:MAG TPA: YfiR family protein [Gammaproteobacteria bacterium]